MQKDPVKLRGNRVYPEILSIFPEQYQIGYDDNVIGGECYWLSHPQAKSTRRIKICIGRSNKNYHRWELERECMDTMLSLTNDLGRYPQSDVDLILMNVNYLLGIDQNV
ncbi:MAG: hypothetical protein [Bacteriophage sp.]|nr:MAG: hypothetical protein [Bacteriophage sp.]